MKMYRQGDVLLVEGKPERGDELPREAGAVVLAHGEVTGHRHAFYGAPEAAVIAAPSVRQLRLVESRSLRHEEHSPIEIPAGSYDLPRQVEWTDENEPRVVAD